MMDILISETCWAHKKWNKIASDIKLVFHSSAMSPYSVAILCMKLRHSTLSLHFSLNYVTVLCRYTFHEITSPYSVATLFMKLRHRTLSLHNSWNYVPIIYMKLGHGILSPYFTWNYPASRFEQLTLLLRILEVPRSYFGPVTGCPAECLVIFLSLIVMLS